MKTQPQVLIVSESEAQYRNFRNLVSDQLPAIDILRTDSVGEACSIIRNTGIDALVIEPSALLAAASLRPRPESRYATKGNAKEDLAFVRNYIYRHYSEKITVEYLANLISVTPNYLCQTFRKEQGVNITVFIVMVRLERAATLLQGTELKIKTISQSVGFPTVSYFCKRFRAVYGLTPREYRATYRGQNNGDTDKEGEG